MSAQSLTLYQIEEGLLQLLQLRDDVADEVRVTPEDEAERSQALDAMDEEIAEYVAREVVKCDNIAGLIRECHQRAETLKAEEKRIAGLRKRWEDREQRVKDRAAEVMAMQAPKGVTEDDWRQKIAAATQGTVLKRITGKSSELKLCKSLGSVEVTDTTLLPLELKHVTIEISGEAWAQFTALLNDAAGQVLRDLRHSSIVMSPDKRAIGAVLKSKKSCERCNGMLTDPGYDVARACVVCGGSGTVPGTVPGARLIQDSVHLRLG